MLIHSANTIIKNYRKFCIVLLLQFLAISNYAQIKAFGFTYKYDSINSRFFITSVYPESPADKAGIKENHTIISIDGMSTKNKSMSEFANMLAKDEVNFEMNDATKNYSCSVTKKEIDININLLQGLNTLLRNCDSGFEKLKGDLVYDMNNPNKIQFECKVNLHNQKYATVLIPNPQTTKMLYKAVTLFSSSSSMIDEEIEFDNYATQLKYFFGNQAYYLKNTGKDFQSLKISRKTNNGYEPSRINFAIQKNNSTNKFELTLTVEEGVKPICNFIKPDSTLVDKSFKQTILFLAGNVFHNKIKENLMGAKISDASGFDNPETTYKLKYDLGKGVTAVIKERFMNISGNPYYLSIKYPSVKGIDNYKVYFKNFFNAISNSLNNFIWQSNITSDIDKLLHNQSVVFAYDSEHIVPDKSHTITLLSSKIGKDEYEIEIQME